jgi:hypothetical protein
MHSGNLGEGLERSGGGLVLDPLGRRTGAHGGGGPADAVAFACCRLRLQAGVIDERKRADAATNRMMYSVEVGLLHVLHLDMSPYCE